MTTPESPASLLRRAAGLMRERAEACASMKWSWEPLADDSETAVRKAGHITSWSPPVALAVAEWLDVAAEALPGAVLVHALRIARAYLNETDSSDKGEA